MLKNEDLNKHFCRDISNWYFRTLKKCSEDKEMPDDNSLIRFLIRTLFCRFITGKPKEDSEPECNIPDEASLKELTDILSSYRFTDTENTLAANTFTANKFKADDSAIGPELLGTIFENLLADPHSKDRLTARSRTGSFYTPHEIVNYMIDESLKNCLGRNLKKNDLIDAVDNLKILDPACGSGTFLIGIVNKLTHILNQADPDNKLWKEKQIKRECADLEEVENVFNNNPPDYARRYYIIKNIIYGVDIQPAAVEISICRLLILLHASRGCSSLGQSMSAVRPKFAAADTLVNFEPESMFGIKNKFSIVIGNPPYIEFKKLSAAEKEKLARYRSAKGKYDIYAVFMERSLELLGENGIFCCILPTTFMKKEFGSEIRKIISESFRVICIQDFAGIQVFGSATSYTGVFLFRKESGPKEYEFSYCRYKNTEGEISMSDLRKSLTENKSDKLKDLILTSASELTSSAWNFHSGKTKELIQKIYSGSKPLSDYAEAIFQGISSGKDEVFYVSDETIREFNIERGILRKLLKGRNIKNWKINWSGCYVIYPYDEHSLVLPEQYLIKEYPNAYFYLQKKRDLLEGRNYFDETNKRWYELWNQRNCRNFDKIRIVTPEISQKSNFALTDSFYGNTKTYHIIPKQTGKDFQYYLLALLNSKLIDFIYKETATPYAHGFYAYKTQFLKNIPVKINENKDLIIRIAKAIEYLSNHESRTSPQFFISLLDSLVYELYLPETENNFGI